MKDDLYWISTVTCLVLNIIGNFTFGLSHNGTRLCHVKTKGDFYLEKFMFFHKVGSYKILNI